MVSESGPHGPLAVALGESMGVSPRPFLVAVMIAGSAAFATPFGYQTNVLVYQMAGYRYMDFVKIEPDHLDCCRGCDHMVFPFLRSGPTRPNDDLVNP
jgi:hypothetical protein